MSTPRPRLRRIKSGEGIVCTYQADDTVDDRTTIEKARYVGTQGIIVCVGLYLPLNANQFALFHVYASTPPPPDDPQQDILCSPSDGARVKEVVLQKLRHSESIWNLDRSYARSRTLVICPAVGFTWNGNHSPSFYVVEALKEFLGSSDLVVDSECGGFYVDLQTKEVVKVQRQAAEAMRKGDFAYYRQDPPEFAGVVVVDENGAKEWRIVVDMPKEGLKGKGGGEESTTAGVKRERE